MYQFERQRNAPTRIQLADARATRAMFASFVRSADSPSFCVSITVSSSSLLENNSIDCLPRLLRDLSF